MLSSCTLERYNPTPEEESVSGNSTTQNSSPQGSTQIPEDEKVYRYTGNPDYPIMAKAYLNALPAHDFNGSTFFITSPDVSYLDPDEIHYLSKDIAERNKAVEEKYNIRIETSRANSDFMLDDAIHAAKADMYYTNLMCIPLGDVGLFEVEGVLMNLRSIPYLDTTMPYFNQSSVTALSAGNKLYGIAGEATPVTDLPCVIYNKLLAEEYALPDLYSLALSGGFTWDKLLEYSALADASAGIAGAAVSGGVTYDYIFKSLGENYVYSDEMLVPTCGLTDTSLDWTATYARYMTENAAAVGITKENAVSSFAEGKVLFTIGTIGTLDDYRNTEVLVGMLPMPKENAESPYRSMVNKDALVMCVPEGTTNSEMSSLVISALNASSYGHITESIVNYFHATTLPDNRSASVLEIISHSAMYDLSTAFESTMTPLFNIKNVTRNIIDTGDFSVFKKSVEEANTALSNKFKLKY